MPHHVQRVSGVLRAERLEEYQGRPTWLVRIGDHLVRTMRNSSVNAAVEGLQGKYVVGHIGQHWRKNYLLFVRDANKLPN